MVSTRGPVEGDHETDGHHWLGKRITSDTCSGILARKDVTLILFILVLIIDFDF